MHDNRDMSHNPRLNDTTEMASPRAATPAEKNAADKVSGPVGGASGALVGGTVGTLVGGPIGTAVGALAGAVGGWWASRGVAEAIPTDEDERRYQEHYSSHAGSHGASAGTPQSIPEREAAIPTTFDRVRPAYQIGHVAARNPAYAGKRFEEIEDDLSKAWSAHLSAGHGEWNSVRSFVQEAYGQRPKGQR